MKRTRSSAPAQPQIQSRLWTGDQHARDLFQRRDADTTGVLLQHARIADVTKQEGEEDERLRRFRISTETRDRHGDVVRSKGLSLKHYRKNPVVLFAHDASAPPIGRSPRVEIGDGTVDADVSFFEREVFEFADTIFRIVDVGGLKATSIGFMPLDYERLQDENDEDLYGIDFKKSDLLEFSIVPIPANPEAVARTAAGGSDMKPYLRWLDDMQDNYSALEGLMTDLDVDEDFLQTVRRAADGRGIQVLTTKDLGDAEPEEEASEDEAAGEEPGETASGESEVRGPIGYRQAHPNGTPAQAQDAEWDGDAEVAAAEVEDLLVMSAWRQDKTRDELNKSDFKLPHHAAAGQHAVNFRACSAAIAALNGARGGVDIPDADRKAVYNHLAHHIREDFGEEPPELRWMEVQPLANHSKQFVFDHETCTLLAWHDGQLVDANALAWQDEEQTVTASAEGAGEVDKQTFTIQSVAGRKSKWASRQAFLDWAKDHGFRTDKVDTTRSFWRLRQRDPEDFERMRTLCINPNDVTPDSKDCRAQAVGGPLKEEAAGVDAEAQDDLLSLAYRTAATCRARDMREGVYGRDLSEGMQQRLQRFEGFFQVTGGTAMDLGEEQPNDVQDLDGAPTFARVIEDRNFDGNKARDLGDVTREDAEGGARQIVEAQQDPDLLVVVGESVGTYREAPLYRDAVAWRWVAERGEAVRIPLGAQLTDPIEQLCELAQTVGKAGRVLSQANETRLRQALDLLSSVLEQLGNTPDPDEEEEAEGASLGAGEGQDKILEELWEELGLDTPAAPAADDAGGDNALAIMESVDAGDFSEALSQLVKDNLGEAVRNSAREEIRKVTGTVD